LLHALVENATLSNADAIGVIRTAVEVKVEVASAAHESKARMGESLTLLSRMAASFEVDELDISSGERSCSMVVMFWSMGNLIASRRLGKTRGGAVSQRAPFDRWSLIGR
jgi:hypothetical protein